VVPGVIAGTIKGAVNSALDYRAGSLVPFPPGVTCPGVIGEEPPSPEPDNIREASGSVTGVGRGSATLRVSGRFTPEQAVALDQAALTVHSLLRELEVGDAVEGMVPLTLQPLNGSKAGKGLYHTPSQARPIVSARVEEVKGSGDGSMEFEIEVKNATIHEPARSRDGFPTAPLETSFQLVGRNAEPVWVHAAVDWECNDGQLLAR
jgi:hypothetical protein